MADETGLEGLSEEEIAELVASSGQQPEEDSTSWAARVRRETEDAKAKAKARREAAVADQGEQPEGEAAEGQGA